MRDRHLGLVALLLLAVALGLAVGLLSCQGDESAAPPTGSTVGTPENRAPFVGALLPGGAGTRWEEQDADAVDQALSDARVDHSVDTAEDAGTQAQEALSRATVLLLAPVDGPTGAAIVQAAKGAGVPVVQYDRVPLAEPFPDYFAGYDREAIGRMQAQGLVRCLGDRGIAEGSFIAVNGPEGDPTAEALEEGYTSALGFDTANKAMVELGTVRAPDWTAESVRAELGALLDGSGDVDGVLATSDALATGTVAELASRGLTDVSVTGGGATVGGIQRILAGRQCTTVYQPVGTEAGAAAHFAAEIGRGVVPDLQNTILVGKRRLAAIVSEPVEITDDVQLINDTVVRDGAMTWEQICTPAYERFCPPPSQRQGQ